MKKHEEIDKDFSSAVEPLLDRIDEWQADDFAHKTGIACCCDNEGNFCVTAKSSSTGAISAFGHLFRYAPELMDCAIAAMKLVHDQFVPSSKRNPVT